MRFDEPYFIRYGIKEEPKFGYSWHAGKTFLLHYVESGEEADEKLNETVSGRMVRGTAEADVIARNKFANANADFVGAKQRVRSSNSESIIRMKRSAFGLTGKTDIITSMRRYRATHLIRYTR